MARRAAIPYWISAGSEICERCGARYVLEMEYRCSHCDAGVCEQCAVRLWERRELLCGGCHGEQEARR